MTNYETYALTALWTGEVESTPIEAVSKEDAMLEAIDVIMLRAQDRLLWAKGEITLRRQSTGELVARMGPKPMDDHYRESDREYTADELR